MAYEKSERRSAFLIGYCTRRLAPFLQKLFEDIDGSYSLVREFEVHLGIIEENMFLLAQTQERALVADMSGLTSSLKSSCWEANDFVRSGRAVPAFTRHRAAEFADKIETLAPLLARSGEQMRIVHDFGGAIAIAVTMAEAGVGERNDGWDQALLLKDGLTEEEQGLAYMAFNLGLGDGDHLLDSIGGRIKRFGLGLSELDEREAAHIDQGPSKPSGHQVAPLTEVKAIQVPSLNEERNNFIYNQRKNGKQLKAILIQINLNPNWEPLEKVESVHKALKDHAKRNGLPMIRVQRRKKRNPGAE